MINLVNCKTLKKIRVRNILENILKIYYTKNIKILLQKSIKMIGIYQYLIFKN